MFESFRTNQTVRSNSQDLAMRTAETTRTSENDKNKLETPLANSRAGQQSMSGPSLADSEAGRDTMNAPSLANSRAGRESMGNYKIDNTNPSIMQIITQADVYRQNVPLGWVLATLYHESKLKQFNAEGLTLRSGQDYGIGQINKKAWPTGTTELSDECIEEVDFDKVKTDWYYNLEVAGAIMSNRKKRVEKNHSDSAGFNKFIAMYAMYNGGPSGYKMYLNGTGSGKEIAKHIDGANGLVDDLDGLLSVLENEHKTINAQWEKITDFERSGEIGKKLIEQVKLLNRAIEEVKKLIAHKKDQIKPL